VGTKKVPEAGIPATIFLQVANVEFECQRFQFPRWSSSTSLILNCGRGDRCGQIPAERNPWTYAYPAKAARVDVVLACFSLDVRCKRSFFGGRLPHPRGSNSSIHAPEWYLPRLLGRGTPPENSDLVSLPVRLKPNRLAWRKGKVGRGSRRRSRL
jgi:hypothetical protein